QRASSGVENQGGEEQVGLAQNVATLDHVQKCHQQQERDRQSDHYDQGHASCRLLLFCLCSCHLHPPRMSQFRTPASVSSFSSQPQWRLARAERSWEWSSVLLPPTPPDR